MIRTPVFTQTLIECRETAIVGGKAANLGRLARAGFPVPEGFVVTTRAYLFAKLNSLSDDVPAEMPPDVAEEIRNSYMAMGGGRVAVRSSATAEDTGAASMAGQYETFLDIEGETPLLEAVLRCWASIDAPRIRAYLQEHNIDHSCVAMAVVVQRLIPAEVAGVLFTSNPQNTRRREMLVEASWGLGEAVVSGRVQPDVLRVEQDTGRVISATIADKRVRFTPGTRGEQPVEESYRRKSCLCGRDVHRLWELGMRAAEHFGTPQDIEWAIHAEQVYLLQSRPITTLQDAEAYEDLLRSTRQTLRQETASGRGPWALHNLAETLPQPTPLTWSVIERFMSGGGGYGQMYRQAGFEPSPDVCRDGFLKLIAGRIYMDAGLAPEMFFADFPFVYDAQELKRAPDASQMPPTVPRGSFSARVKAGRLLQGVNENLHELSRDYDRRLRDSVFPEIERYVAQAKQVDLQALDVERLIELWQEREKQVLDVFAPQTLMPSLIGAMALGELRTFLAENFWDEEPDALAQMISSGGPPDRTVLADSELFEVARGTRSLDAWLDAHGHRAAGEFELAARRWREQRSQAAEMAAMLASGANPIERHRHNSEAVKNKITELRSRLSRPLRREFDRRIELVRRYVVFREDGKDYLMLGYDLLRDLALEAGRRLDIKEDVFFLTREDVFDCLRVGFAPYHLIERRKIARRADTRLNLPRVIDEKVTDTLGDHSEKLPVSGRQKAYPLSAGEASGPARIVVSPTQNHDLGRGYVLICTSTDPSWTPLFVNAAGLVLECGGALSHGAVVAREMGLPAVVLPDATTLFHDGVEICVDGNQGWVYAGTEERSRRSLDEEQISDDPRVPHSLTPPPPGRKDRIAARVRNYCALIWTVYLLGFFFLPVHWVNRPTMQVLDFLLWPMVRSLGGPAVVAIVAAGVALATLLSQKFIADNRRLREAKRRAALLGKMANSLPSDSPRRAALLRLASPVQFRSFAAAMVPVGIFLGPMVMPLVWFQQRIDPAVIAASPGSAVSVMASVSGDWRESVRIEAPEWVAVDESTPRSRTLPPLRNTLERVLALLRQPPRYSDETWQLKFVPDLAREQTANDLKAFLDKGIPPQGITWLLRTPDDFSGRFAVKVTAQGHAPATIDVVVGNDCPPAPNTALGAGGSPVREVRVTYARPKVAPVFWQPFASLAGNDSVPFASWLSTLRVGWLWMYIIVYLPIVMFLRTMLRVA
jgi:phosphohistidine swiveling domain-containing protein